MAARLFSGDLDIAVYSGNWDLNSYVPSRSCAYCYWNFDTSPLIEDEWHVLLICPLHENLRRGMPFTADELCVEGHSIQGKGCTKVKRHLQSLVGAILRT